MANIVSSYTETVLSIFDYLCIETDSDGELYINNLYSSFSVGSGEAAEKWDDRYEQACGDEMISVISRKISETW